MKYFFIEYTANEMIDGNWQWYLDSYKKDATGARQWVTDGKLSAGIYAFPKAFRSYWMTHISYTPGRAGTHGHKVKPAPPGVRWGIMTAIHEDFIAEIGAAEFAQCTHNGPIHTPDGVAAKGWRAAVVRNELKFTVGEDDSADCCLPKLNGEAISRSDRFSLIIRGDLAWKLTAARFPGCRVHWRGKD